MLIFSVYTFAVWFMAFRWRRSWSGLLAVFAGLGGMLLTYQIIASLEPGHNDPYPMMKVLLLSYAGMLFVGGVYIVLLPRPVAVHTCDRCGYELTGLAAVSDLETAKCPECGSVGSVIAPGCVRRLRVRRVSPSRPATAAPPAAPAPAAPPSAAP